MKVLILGANGMFGSMVSTVLAAHDGFTIEQTTRSAIAPHAGMPDITTHHCDVLDTDALLEVLFASRPEVVVNCTGLIKQRPEADDVLKVLPINALFSHRLARICKGIGTRLIHFSTDCVFSGKTGNYADDAPTDAQDYYGMSKHLGEIADQPNVLTLRTSIIGHEAHSALQLVDWFLAQEGAVTGYRRAIFSGFPTAEIGHILAEYVLPRQELHGLYNISAEPISKYDLLTIVRDVYRKEIEIIPDDAVEIDRSLNSSALRSILGYVPPSWLDLVTQMRATRPEFTEQK